MGVRIKVILATALVVLCAVPVLGQPRPVLRSSEMDVSPPAPRLRYPVTDKVVLNGKDYVEFQWWNDFTRNDRYIFKIYKGYTLYGQDLVLQEEVPSSRDSFRVKADVFQEGQVYTWSLVAVARSGRKSDRSTQPFKVIK